MTSYLTGRDAIVMLLRDGMRVGEGLSVPYARKWAIGGCAALHSLWDYPHDAILDFARGLMGLDFPILSIHGSIGIEINSKILWIAVNGHSRNAERVSEFLIGHWKEPTPLFVSNSSEVIIELVKEYGASPGTVRDNELVQIGFPGIKDGRRTYVGSWQWNVHGEAYDEEFICRAANATLSAIRIAEARNDN
jgi:hypothetical protein